MPSSGFQTCALDRKSTRLNSSHTIISYAVFCLKKNKHVHNPCSPLRHSLPLLRTHHPRTTSRWLLVSQRISTEVAPITDSLSMKFFFFNDTATTEIYTLSLHDALPI